MKKIAIFLMTLGVLSGCATSTPYGPYKDTFFSSPGGYTDTKLQESIYRISFVGNDDATGARSADFAILRCAEVALRDGYSYFVVSNERTETASNIAYYKSGPAYFSNMPVSSYVIQCFKEKPQTTAVIYNADEVRRNIRVQYGMKETVPENKIGK